MDYHLSAMTPVGMLFCPLCQAEYPHESIELTERMYGLGHTFEYVQCGGCKTLRIKTVPDNIGDYYPQVYHGHMADVVGESPRHPIKKWLIGARDVFELTGHGIVGRLIASRKPAMDLRYVRPLEMTPGESILDVGCGQGRIIARMRSMGITAHGVDPFIDSDLGSRESGFWVRKGYLSDIPESYDAILMNHSFEHMPNPLEILQQARETLKPSGRMLIRIPTISCEMWDRYGVLWYQLDAPRHLFLHSREGIQALAEQAGWVVKAIIDDSDRYQFIGSELYRAGSALYPETDEGWRRREEIIAGLDVQNYDRESERLNREHRGDQIAVLLQPA